MIWFAIVPGIIIGMLSVAAWGTMQVLDVLEALALRQEAKARRLREARKYLEDPQGYVAPSTGQAMHDTWSSSNVSMH